MRRTRAEVQASVDKALACPESQWYRQVLQQDPSGCPLSEAEIVAVLNGAQKAAAEMAHAVAEKYPGLSPLDLAAALGLGVAPMEDGADLGAIPLLGLFQPATARILTGEETLAAIAGFIVDYELASRTPVADLRPCVLYHEIFHALEESSPQVFTRTAMLQRKWFGLFPRRRGLAAASEIGAIHFSRLMAGLSYSPCIFGHYLLLLRESAESADLPETLRGRGPGASGLNGF